jgi:hypothetical protein
MAYNLCGCSVPSESICAPTPCPPPDDCKIFLDWDCNKYHKNTPGLISALTNLGLGNGTSLTVFAEKVDSVLSPTYTISATYAAMLIAFNALITATFPREHNFYVTADEVNMAGKKGAYKYIPGFTPTPAQITINFND